MAPPSTGPALPAPPPGVDLDAEFVNITPDRFTSVPKSSHRSGAHRLTSLLALGVLTLYLSNKTGWKIPNAEKLATEWQEGADRIRAAIADLERAGFLVRFRIQGERGRWFTRTFISADPATLEPIRQYAAALDAAYAAAKANKAAAIDDRTYSQVAPDGGFRDSVDRDSADRHSATGHLKDQETDLGDQEEDPPPPPGGDSTAPAADQAATGGNFDGETRAMLNTAAEAAAKARDGAKGWKPAQVRAAIRDALAGGHAPALVAERLALLAADTTGTTYPTRLRAVLDIAAAEAARKADQVAAAAPPWTQGPVRYVDPGRPRCRDHRDYPADNCAQHAIDAKIAAGEARIAAEDAAAGAAPPAAAPVSASEARAVARARAAAARENSRTRKADKRPTVPRQHAPADPPATDETPEPVADPAPEPVSVAA